MAAFIVPDSAWITPFIVPDSGYRRRLDRYVIVLTKAGGTPHVSDFTEVKRFREALASPLAED